MADPHDLQRDGDRFGIGSREEAEAYLAGLPGTRCARASAAAVCEAAAMTVFAAVADDDRDFVAVLEQYYGGDADPQTLQLLATS